MYQTLFYENNELVISEWRLKNELCVIGFSEKTGMQQCAFIGTYRCTTAEDNFQIIEI